MHVAPRRPDGRGPGELRARDLRLGEVPTAAGSAWFTQGNSHVAVTVLGPVASKVSEEKLASATVSVTSHFLDGIPNGGGGASKARADALRTELARREVDLSMLVEDVCQSVVVLEQYPRCTIHLSVRVLCDDGCVEAVAVNAVMSALLDAGVSCRYTAVAMGVKAIGQRREDSNSPLDDKRGRGASQSTVGTTTTTTTTTVLIDPCRDEEEEDDGGDDDIGTVAALSSSAVFSAPGAAGRASPAEAARGATWGRGLFVYSFAEGSSVGTTFPCIIKQRVSCRDIGVYQVMERVAASAAENLHGFFVKAFCS